MYSAGGARDGARRSVGADRRRARDLYGDAFNEEVFMRPGAQLTHALVEVDDEGVDGSVNALARW